MINTGISSYLQNAGVQKENFLQPQSQTSINNEVEEEKSTDGVNVILSPESNAMLKIDNLQQQLDKIFGVKKDLNSDELEKEKDLKAQIKELKANFEVPYSTSDKESIRNIDNQMKEILEKEQHSYEDDTKLFDLSKQIDLIVKKYDDPSIKDEDSEKLSELVKELRTLQGYKNPDVPELIDAEKIYTQIDIINIKLKASQLDINSASFDTENTKLQAQFALAQESLLKLENDKVEYKEEETRETAKNTIKNSLKNIATIQNDFSAGSSSANAISEQTYGLTGNSSTGAKENKWLDFLQTTREELYAGPKESDTTTSEDSDLLNIINRVKSLHA